MVESIVDINLFVDEKMEIKRNRFSPLTADNKDLRVAIVTGIHGDELEGQYVCYQVVKRLNEEPERIKGIIDVYPALNPMGIDSISRELPLFDMDMNRIFPGSENRTVAELMAQRIISDLEGS
ncbi:MAG: succinylglutamate desuccinylase/aspartoacylase family protein, partial [Vallitaleaceae bacterium]|nr:succinylglutamate desuccinylase/aspartoacylase family protein [Vallitaleaceae bacterium]